MSATRALLVLLALLLAGCDSETWWPRLRARGGGGTTLDFTNQADADAALVYSRTGGDAYLQSGASALRKVVAGSGSLWEDRGDSWGPGLWTWPAYTDDIVGQFDICGAGWTRQGTLSVVTNSSPAPYAAASANKLVAASNADGCFRAMAVGPPYRQGSIWIKDVAGSAPTSPGAWQINTTGVGQATNLLTGTTWRRISYAQNGGFAAIYVAGKQPTHPLFELGDNRGGATSTPASGSIYAWGAHSTIGDVPLVDKSTGITDVHLAAGPLAQVISPIGDLDIELVVENVFLNYDFVDNTRDAYLFSATSPDGPMSLRYKGTTGEWKFAIRGADVLTATQWGPGPQFADMKVRVTYKPSDGTASLTFWMAGSDQMISDATGKTTGGALQPLTNFWLGSNGGTSSGYAGRWRSL